MDLFRHTFATRCFESNVPVKTVQGYLGQASIQMTLDLYTHVMEEQKQSDMTKLENTLEFLLRHSGIEIP